MSKYFAFIPINLNFAVDLFDNEEVIQELFEPDLSYEFNRRTYNLGTFQFVLQKTVSERDIVKHNLKVENYDYILKVIVCVKDPEFLKLKNKDKKENLSFLILQRIYNAIIVFNIAKPGLFETGEGLLILNDDVEWKIDKIHHRIIFAIMRNKDIKWPIIEVLEIKKVWDWYFRNEKGIDDFSSNSIERAINAFSYLFDSIEILRMDELSWMLLALEALYCNGTYNLKGQLCEKTELFLGKRTEFKKEVSKMYDFRSRFLHGDLNFNNRYVYSDNSDQLDEFHFRDYSNSINMAISILISTFQKMVNRNITEINFELKLID